MVLMLKLVDQSKLKRANVCRVLGDPRALKRGSMNPSGKPSEDGYMINCISTVRGFAVERICEAEI